MALHDKLRATGPKKLLAIDGGGIRGVIALEVLARIEELLGKGDPGFHVADYFDLIAGNRAGLLRRYTHHKFEDEKLAEKLKAEFGADTKLGSDRLQTLLILVMRNATTDSPWPLSNNATPAGRTAT